MADKQAKGRAATPAAKLNAQEVQEIRIRYAAGGVSYGTLAAQYGVSRHNVAMVIRRRIWR
ncbi:hypothetical protein [Deinococcus kurensis]|uniref:hypothetical protein n=1 Tax=Deinococcus kurensis TaxID=2662757 RepID=UPI001F21A28F|nr:hypothetical protein [Deinococcus kurensis]